MCETKLLAKQKNDYFFNRPGQQPALWIVVAIAIYENRTLHTHVVVIMFPMQQMKRIPPSFIQCDREKVFDDKSDTEQI